MEVWQIVAIVLAVLAIVVMGALFVRKAQAKKRVSRSEAAPETPAIPPSGGAPLVVGPRPGPEPIPAAAVAKVLPPALGDKLSKSRSSLFGRLEKLFSRNSLDPQEWDELEEILLEADVGVNTTQQILGRVREAHKEDNTGNLRELVGQSCREILQKVEPTPFALESVPKPWVISIVGVNGVGKTTTIGKLAKYFSGQGKTVLMGAADTFRAGATSQLRTWAEREGAQFVSGREGGDPGAVAFDSVAAAKARGVDVVLLDTAGRLHTKTGLMDELKKVHRVMKKVIPEAPHETWLVLDGNLGQNSISQAREFQKSLELTGIIVTKLDGTSKGGAVLGIASELNLPVRFIGVGESSDDFLPFKADNFIQAIVSG